MKTRIALLACVFIVIAVMAGVGRQTLSIVVQLRSDPFPLNVGPTDLLVSLVNADGTAVEDAVVHISAQMNHPGMTSLESQPVTASGGLYRVPLIWPMAGQWILNITAALPDRADPVREQFVVFVYPTPPYLSFSQSSYRSQSEINAVVTANQAHEFWIVIPQGTAQMLISGEDHDLIPDEIRLQTSGRNVLVIRNDDLADHTIGPFFVQAGETIRQTFTQPAVFQGTCSIKHSDEISIIVEA